MNQDIRIPKEFEKIPADSGGVYAFKLRYPSDMELGIHRDEFQISRVKGNIQNVLEKMSNILDSQEYTGVIKDFRSGKHLTSKLQINAKTEQTSYIGELFSSCIEKRGFEFEDYKELSASLRTIFIFSPPIYIGIAQKQSLRKRAEQHYDGGSGFAVRLKALNVSWRELNYCYMAVKRPDTLDVRDLEKLAQNIFKPILSDR